MKLSEFTMPELRLLLAECNFTEEEEMVFRLLAKGKTIEYTAEECSMGVSTIKRTKKRIWSKIGRILKP